MSEAFFVFTPRSVSGGEERRRSYVGKRRLPVSGRSRATAPQEKFPGPLPFSPLLFFFFFFFFF